jgi:hypothetical protein
LPDDVARLRSRVQNDSGANSRTQVRGNLEDEVGARTAATIKDEMGRDLK